MSKYREIKYTHVVVDNVGDHVCFGNSVSDCLSTIERDGISEGETFYIYEMKPISRINVELTMKQTAQTNHETFEKI